MASTISITATGNAVIDGLLSGIAWVGPITFGLPTSGGFYGYDPERQGFAPLPGPVTLPETLAWAAVRAVAALTEVSALAMPQSASPDTATIRFARTSTPDAGVGSDFVAYAYYPYDESFGDIGGDIWVSTEFAGPVPLGSFEHYLLLHELGHAVGLKHGHEAEDGFPALPLDRDSPEFSVMTYRGWVGDAPDFYELADGHAPQSYMMLDIAALQRMYGANYATRAGSTLYRFEPDTGEVIIDGVSQGVARAGNGSPVNVLFRTIWDGGGIDTYDFSLYGASAQLRIDLRPGEWTDVDADSTLQAAYLGGGPNGGHARGQVANALLHLGNTASLIENAVGGFGDDHATGNQVANWLEGRNGNDMLFGLAGDDTLQGGMGNDTLDGGEGIDTADYSDATSAIVVDLGTAGAQNTLGSGFDTLASIESAIGGVGGDALTGNSAANRLEGRAGNDVLRGLGGNDTLRGGHGDDTLDGGDGIDTADYADAPSRVVVNLATVVAQNTQGRGVDTLAGIENLVAGAFNDVLVGSTAYNVIDAGAGNDLIYGSTGFDTLLGGAGNDTVDYSFLAGGISAGLAFVHKRDLGGDTLVGVENLTGTNFDDVLSGDDANNVLMGLGGDDMLAGGRGTDRLDGGDGTDLADYRFSGVPVTVYLNPSSSTGPTIDSPGVDYFVSIEGFVGSNFGDTLVGNAGANVLRGEAGDDRLFGLDGDDILRGGPGYDLFYGGAGSDTADYSDAIGTVRALLGLSATFDTIGYGRDWYFDIENLAGGGAKDFLTGDGNANRIEGNGGNDVIVGGGGDDTLLGGAGNDDITGGLGADLIVLGPAADNDIIRYASAAESRVAGMDRIEGFTQSGLGFDRIGFENAAGALFAGVTPGAIALGSKVTLAAAADLASLAAQLGGLAASTPGSLAVTQVDVAAGAAAGSYLAVSDLAAGFDLAADMLVGIRFAAGHTLTAGNLFLF
jgi:serralysin